MPSAGPYTWIAIGLVIVEGLVLLVFGGRCPLTILARYNKLIFATVYVVGLVAVGYRLLHRT